MANIDKELMTKRLIEKFEESKLKILYAKYGPYPSPKKIRNYEPDIIGIDVGQHLYHFGVVTTPDEIQSEFTTKKLKSLSGMMMAKGSSEGTQIPTHVGVPKQCTNTITQHLEKTNLSSQGDIRTVEV